MASENTETPAATITKKSRRSPNDYLRLGVCAIYNSIAEQHKTTKKKKRGTKPEGRALSIPKDTAKHVSKLLEIVVKDITRSATASTLARKRRTIMPVDVLYAVSNKFLISSALLSKHTNELLDEHSQQYVSKIKNAVDNARKVLQTPACVICEEQELSFRSVYSETALRQACSSTLKVSRDSVIALTVFIHYFCRFICFMAVRNQIRDASPRLKVLHVQQAIRGTECLSPHFSRVRILGGYHYPNAYGKISDGDKLCSKRNK